MGDMGLESAFGNAAMAAEIRQRIKDQIEAEARAQALRQQQFTNNRQLAGDARATRQLDQNDQLRRDALAETTRQHSLADAERQDQGDIRLGDTIPAGEMAPDAPAPLVGRLQRIGLIDSSKQRPAVDVGPLLPGDTGQARGVLKMASQKQNVDAANQADKTADNARQAKATAEQASRDAEIGRHNRAMENKPAAELGWTIQQGTVNGKPGWVRINSRSGEVRPVDPGEITPKPSAQQAEHDRTSRETLDTLSQLDQAIENAKDLIGPGAGRISNLEQMAGSADPRIQALGVKMKAAKMRVDHAVTGSVRAAASPQMMQQWDNILANKVTPEGLKAGVQAMREILGGGASEPAAEHGGMPTVGGTFQGGKVLKVEKVQ